VSKDTSVAIVSPPQRPTNVQTGLERGVPETMRPALAFLLRRFRTIEAVIHPVSRAANSGPLGAQLWPTQIRREFAQANYQSWRF
jgi:hypothetical protein